MKEYKENLEKLLAEEIYIYIFKENFIENLKIEELNDFYPPIDEFSLTMAKERLEMIKPYSELKIGFTRFPTNLKMCYLLSYQDKYIRVNVEKIHCIHCKNQLISALPELSIYIKSLPNGEEAFNYAFSIPSVKCSCCGGVIKRRTIWNRCLNDTSNFPYELDIKMIDR